MRMLSIALAAALLAVPAFAQTTGVPGVNDLTLNGVGSGGTSCVAYQVPAGPSTLAIGITSAGNEPLIGAFSNACVPGAVLTADPLYTLDLNPAGLAIAFDGTGIFLPPNPLTPFFNTPASGVWGLTITINPPLGPVLSLQTALLGPGFATGLGLTQAIDIVANTSVCSVGTNTNAGDDTTYAWTTNSPVSYYGNLYTTTYVDSNGYLSFCGSGFSDFSPTEAEMLSGDPRIAGFWSDIDPGSAGAVKILETPAAVEVCYQNVPLWGCATPATDQNTWEIKVDLAVFDITLTYGSFNLCGGTIPGGNVGAALVGISPGVTQVATNCPVLPAVQSPLNNVDLSLPYFSVNPYEAIYEYFATTLAFDLAGTTKNLLFVGLPGYSLL